MKAGVLYRMFDASGALLYIGATASGPRRFDAHAGTAPWWTDVARIAIAHYPTRDEAFDAERAAILAEQPRWNRSRPGRAPGNACRGPYAGMRIHGAVVRAMRELSGYTGVQFAAQIGVSPQYLSDIERGRRGARAGLVKRIAETLNVATVALLVDPEPVG